MRCAEEIIIGTVIEETDDGGATRWVEWTVRRTPYSGRWYVTPDQPEPTNLGVIVPRWHAMHRQIVDFLVCYATLMQCNDTTLLGDDLRLVGWADSRTPLQNKKNTFHRGACQGGDVLTGGHLLLLFETKATMVDDTLRDQLLYSCRLRNGAQLPPPRLCPNFLVRGTEEEESGGRSRSLDPMRLLFRCARLPHQYGIRQRRRSRSSLCHKYY